MFDCICYAARYHDPITIKAVGCFSAKHYYPLENGGHDTAVVFQSLATLWRD